MKTVYFTRWGLLGAYEHRTIQIWNISDDRNEYDRYKTMLDNSLKSVLDDEKISKALKDNSVEKLGDENRVYAISDHCDIRKEYSRKLENLGQVRDLNGNIIHGYSSLGTILLNENKKDITLANMTVFSNKEERFISQEELKKYHNKKIEDKDRVSKIKELVDNDTYINNTVSLKRQSKEISDSLKAKNSDIVICHIHDRFGDNVEYFEHINSTLKDQFVIRAKASRNSNKKKINAKGNEVGIKLISVEFRASITPIKSNRHFKNQENRQYSPL